MSPQRSRRKLLMVGGVVALVVALLAGALFFHSTQTGWVESAPYQRVGEGPAQTLVVVYSRTGNTLGAAREAARYFDADVVEISAPQYDRTVNGQLAATRDASAEVTTTSISHPLVDPSRYELVVLCSPTWWFRPAPPLWAFVENHDLTGREVFLLMTGNSRWKEEKIEGFGALVADKGGELIDSLFLRRGRIYWQKSPDELRVELREALKAREALWPTRGGRR